MIMCWLCPKVEEGSWEKAEMLGLGFSSHPGGIEGWVIAELEEDALSVWLVDGPTFSDVEDDAASLLSGPSLF